MRDLDPNMVKNLLSKAGVREHFRVSPLSGGGNNRGYRVDLSKKSFFLKAYFHHSSDKRDRLKTEFEFCRFLWSRNVHRTPEPLAYDRRHHVGLYEYIQGRPLSARDITKDRVKEAVRFFLEMNRLRHASQAQALPTASEACFSISDQLAIVGGRLERLEGIKPESRRHREAQAFVLKRMFPAWRAIDREVRQNAARLGLSLKRRLAPANRCLSPSDFGFHNAILTSRGTLRFVDFEYGGWDDVAKAVCDFILQPRIPFPMELVASFCVPVLDFFRGDDTRVARANLLFPVFAFKWSCIFLNDFLRHRGQPRAFALGIQERNKRFEQQLVKAEKYLEIARSGHALR